MNAVVVAFLCAGYKCHDLLTYLLTYFRLKAWVLEGGGEQEIYKKERLHFSVQIYIKTGAKLGIRQAKSERNTCIQSTAYFKHSLGQNISDLSKDK